MVALLAAIRARAAWLEANALRARVLVRAKGAPASTIQAGGGRRDPAPVGGHSDPTLRAIEARDPLRVEQLLDEWDDKLKRVNTLLAQVELAYSKTLRPPEDPRPKQKPLAGCVSCARNGDHFEPVLEGRYARYCRFCGDYKAAEGRVPPLGAVTHMHRGGKVTTKVITEALRDEQLGNKQRRRGA